MKFSRPAVINIVLAVLIAGAIAAVLIIVHPFSSSATSATTQLTGTVQKGTVSSTITATGAISPKSEVSAAFTTNGTISSVKVALGDTVVKGQTLAKLKTTDLSTALSTAETQLSRAYTGLSDAESSYATAAAAAAKDPSQAQQASSAKSQVLSAQDQVDQASAAVTTAQENLSAATLKAPISGLVVAVNGTAGGQASAGSTTTTAASSSSTSTSTGTSGVVTIADDSKYVVTASIAEADIASVKKGQAATITFPAVPNLTATAKVTAIAPTATSSNSVVSYSTTITLDKIPDGLRLGQTAQVAITTASSDPNALYVPTAAITTASDGTSTVKVVANGKTTDVSVQTGVVGDSGTEITSGLTAGQTIVLGTVAPTTTGTTGTTGTTRPGGGFGGAGGGAGGTGGFPGGGGRAPTGGN
ncbi:MAG: family efflux transporter subunit [Glaciihabitans sp.]|jgi:macrolide-specific efflux system membrane fusion protein|nr:family efflux transporter subunit [Glaciihabitans sp.]